MVEPLKLKDFKFWTLTIEALEKELDSSDQGLKTEQVKQRTVVYGPNILAKKQKNFLLFEFFAKFTNPLILILIFASFISAFLGEVTDFIVIFSIVILSTLIDFYQQFQAEKASDKLTQKVALTASVLRDGVKLEVNQSSLTVGDLIYLSAGDIIPADARLLEAKELLVNQSSLTGESYPQEKNINTLNEKTSNLSDITNSVFMGTNVISGEATAMVVRIGSFTEFGKVAKHLAEKRPATEFETGIKSFGYLLMKITVFLVITVFLFNTLLKHNVLESLLFALALAVGLTPELLPMILTINLSKGAIKMSKKGVIVKYLPAIQNFGSMNILCTDKTGTLTEDQIKLERYENIKQIEDPNVLLYGFLNSKFQTGIKSPLEKAILEHQEVSIEGYKKIDEIPFDFNRRTLSIIVKENDKNILIAKGAPERVINLCQDLTEELKKKVKARFEELSSQGFRVLALGIKQIEYKKAYTVEDEKELTFTGLMAFLDPPKLSAKSALQALEKQGISLKILTGDNELVTQKVCAELALKVDGIITGTQVDLLDGDQLGQLVKKTTIFARLNPEQKERIILALKKDGDVVGYLGDGINDSASLRMADIGISVNNAVDVAKESADLILLRKDLHVLKDGVIEGRKTYANIMKYIMMASSSNFGNIFSVSAASIFLPFLPMLPVQILLNNLLYDVSQLAVSGDNISPEYLDKPRKWDIGFIKKFMLVFGPISSLFDFITFFILLFIFRATPALFQTGWFIESLITQVLIVFSIRTRVVPFYKSIPGVFLIINCLVIAIVGMLFPFSPLAHFFSFIAPPMKFYLVLLVIIIFYFIFIEVAKKIFYKRLDRFE